MTGLRRRVPAVALTLALAGCAGLPTTGPITRVSDGQPTSRDAARYEPAKPRPGASPQQVVEGYLDAMLAHPQASALVASYLTTEAASDWNPGPGMAVYSQLTTAVDKPTGDRAEATLQFTQVMTVDTEGRASVDPKAVRVPLVLRRQNGQWRVATPLGGYLVSARFATDFLRAFPLWFFDREGRRLVPELTHGLASPQLAAELVQRLVDGPRESSLRTYVPPADRVRVEMRGRVADIHLDGATPESPDRFRAQVLSTLRGVPGVDGVRILIDGVPDGGVHPIDAVVGFGPRSVPDLIYGLSGSDVVAVTNRLRPIAGPWADRGRDAVGVAVDSENVATVTKDRTTVSFGPRTDVSRRTITGTGFVTPSWDDEHRLWLIDQPGAIRVRVIESGAVRALTADLPAGVESLAISPDGARYAAGIRRDGDADVLVGIVERGYDGRPVSLGAGEVVSSGLRGEHGVGWASQTRVAFLAETPYGPQLHSVGFDGGDRSVPTARDAVPGGGIVSWAGPPDEGADRWAVDQAGRVWRQASGGIWSKLTTARLRALSVGR